MKLYDPWRDPCWILILLEGRAAAVAASDSRYKFRLTSFASLTSPAHPPNWANFHILVVGGVGVFQVPAKVNQFLEWILLRLGCPNFHIFLACLTYLPLIHFKQSYYVWILKKSAQKRNFFFLRNAQNVPQSIDRGKTDPTSVGNKKKQFSSNFRPTTPLVHKFIRIQSFDCKLKPTES